ncbi:alpha/beta hydrolase [Saccharibacillus sp. JS10]|uniref:alpha/beta hydrolase n=1 Tax=Saccharibacillus sp. JS10 TaxID=2950552 RepID=UPI00210946D1|nr:alpha/beta hydrolase [Saccharibacillus sp. JS10]MCQ4088313.1 alpha/beta hydrolase [Saccharibacillus sp. JS10]
MSSYTQNIVTIGNIDGVSLQGTFYRDHEIQSYKGTILYLHGGGMIFGQRDDLPELYLSLLTQHGYGVLAVDYLLAPESRLPRIMESVQQSIDWFVQQGKEKLNIDSAFFYLMGRSAGAYLALYHAAQNRSVSGIIALYGYYTLSEASFHVPSRHFLSYPPVSESTMQSLVGKHPVTASHSDQRYLLYLGLRQQGKWLSALTSDPAELKDYSLTKTQFESFPPTFLATADQDPDVPSRQSKMAHKWIPSSELHIVASDEHDFDRTQQDSLGIEIYRKMVVWLDALNKSQLQT